MAIETVLYVVGGIVVIGALSFMFIYNGLITLQNRINNAWSQIDVQLKRRYDLIPNLIETVKGYAKHEAKLLTEVTKSRSQIMSGSPDKRLKANDSLSDTLKSLFAVAENYPQLRANENFLMLQEELTGTENKIAYSRQFYNDSVLNFNNKLLRFPTNLIGKMFGFTEKDYLKTDEVERKNVKVKFED